MIKNFKCDSCYYETPDVRRFKDTYLCALCSETVTGNALDYPEQYENADVLKTICYVGNVILDAIKQKEK